MLIVTGGIACGKTTFLRIAEEMGLRCVDADAWFNNTFMMYEDGARIANTLFGTTNLKEVAFKHPSWPAFMSIVGSRFFLFVKKIYRHIDILVIPDLPKRMIWIVGSTILTIERPDNLEHAKLRDSHRSVELTELIHKNQSTMNERATIADEILFNIGNKKQFEEDCKSWLEQHLQDRSTQRMKAIDTL